MTRIVVASQNPVKIQAALSGFQRSFPAETYTAEGVTVASGVGDQPMTDAATRRGATNRAQNARTAQPNADYWVGIEGGVEPVGGELHCFAWAVVLGRDRVGASRTATFILPREVAELVRDGLELGEADDRVFGRSNSKQQNGAVGLLTGDVIDRAAYYEHALIMALIPFKNLNLNFEA